MVEQELEKERNEELQEESAETTSTIEQEVQDEMNETLSEKIVEEISETDQLKQQVDELNDKVYRLSAEIANIQKRNAKERQDAAKYRSQSLAQNLLSAVDNLERALETQIEDEQAQSLKKGIEMVYESLIAALKQEGIEEIEALNQPFDPNKHQAVQTIAASEDQAVDQVVQVFQKGYTLHDRILRPAMVIVAQ